MSSMCESDLGLTSGLGSALISVIIQVEGIEMCTEAFNPGIIEVLL